MNVFPSYFLIWFNKYTFFTWNVCRATTLNICAGKEGMVIIFINYINFSFKFLLYSLQTYYNYSSMTDMKIWFYADAPFIIFHEPFLANQRVRLYFCWYLTILLIKDPKILPLSMVRQYSRARFVIKSR